MHKRLAFSLIVFIGFLAPLATASDLIWIEAECFQDSGGWTNDAQFIDQMGSPYLLAIGLGTPVEDAVTSVTVPVPGTYRLWVRSKDWVPEHHPGLFQVVLAGQAVGETLGGSGRKGWHWEDGGTHGLDGRVEIRLHDLTGYYGRCDAMLLTRDLDWTPPDDTRAIAELRQVHGGVSAQIEDVGFYDVVVVGGGLAGCTAAVAAARLGADTVLLQNRPVLGGNASTEILVPPVGVWPHGRQDPLNPRETGLVEEYRTAGNQTNSEAAVYSARLLQFVQAEPNVTLCLNTHATSVEKHPDNDDSISAVRAVDVNTGQRLRFAGRVFIDCTGDGVIGVSAGAEYREGKEPRSMYDEPWAPETGSRHTMGNTLKYASIQTDQNHPFAPPPWIISFPSCDSFGPGRHPMLGGRTGDQWKTELGGLRDTYADAEEIRDDLLRLIFGMWDHLKNHCPSRAEEAAQHRLAWVGHVAGKRENRRLIGDVVLTENDIRQQTLFPDRVAYGAWCLDDHHSAGFFHEGSFGVHQDRPGGLDPCQGLHYSIPYRSLYSRNVGNLLMAGRNISASHMALSNTRVMLTCAVIGQAAGTAAALCVQHEATPRGVYREHLQQLQQQLLKDGAHIIRLPNRDDRDLARAAFVTASSESLQDGDAPMVAANVVNGFARAEDGNPNAWSPAADDSEVAWLQLDWQKPQRLNVIHVSFATKRLTADTLLVQAWSDGHWQAIANRDGLRHRRYVLPVEPTETTKLRLVFAGQPSVCEVRVYDEPDRLVKIARRVTTTMAGPDLGHVLPWMIDVDPSKLPGIVIDSSFAEQIGHWVPSTFDRPYVMDGYLHDGNDRKGQQSIRFAPDIPRAGTYEVRLAYVPYANRSSCTPVKIETPVGSATVFVDQRAAPEIDGLFHSLGAFYFPPGQDSRITVENTDTDGYVVVDAIQLLAE